jgi:DNA-binding PucR family transcriptional regulator
LGIGRNTIRPRVAKAEEVLGRKLNIPKDKAELSLAAYIWLRRHDPNILKKAL